MGRFRELGNRYNARICKPSIASTIASERFLGCRGSSSCETISWVWGTVKTIAYVSFVYACNALPRMHACIGPRRGGEALPVPFGVLPKVFFSFSKSSSVCGVSSPLLVSDEESASRGLWAYRSRRASVLRSELNAELMMLYL
jgi:hypothetical protein